MAQLRGDRTSGVRCDRLLPCLESVGAIAINFVNRAIAFGIYSGFQLTATQLFVGARYIVPLPMLCIQLRTPIALFSQLSTT